jgi:hypothetical protein
VAISLAVAIAVAMSIAVAISLAVAIAVAMSIAVAVPQVVSMPPIALPVWAASISVAAPISVPVAGRTVRIIDARGRTGGERRKKQGQRRPMNEPGHQNSPLEVAKRRRPWETQPPIAPVNGG